MRAESYAVWILGLKNHLILAQRFRSPVGEIDIVAVRASLLVFFGIKARPRRNTAIMSLSPRQQRRIQRASALYVARHPALARLHQRFDMVLVQLRRLPEHLRDAWRPRSAF